MQQGVNLHVGMLVMSCLLYVGHTKSEASQYVSTEIDLVDEKHFNQRISLSRADTVQLVLVGDWPPSGAMHTSMARLLRRTQEKKRWQNEDYRIGAVWTEALDHERENCNWILDARRHVLHVESAAMVSEQPMIVELLAVNEIESGRVKVALDRTMRGSRLVAVVLVTSSVRIPSIELSGLIKASLVCE